MNDFIERITAAMLEWGDARYEFGVVQALRSDAPALVARKQTLCDAWDALKPLLLEAAAVNLPEWLPIETRPQDGQLIAYYFEPFKSLHVGRYDKTNDSVGSRSGFSTVIPEVPHWMPMPLPPAMIEARTGQDNIDTACACTSNYNGDVFLCKKCRNVAKHPT